ncbi:hypothetical protein [Demequina muriae]|uniref:SPW repeat-containing protein n=1 Tax=Demequina muriae TaxID=3051664 RepID=A0ABT8GG13_9MICO|nr:hypothetical protein [Demequina sp. EGI L300058]MDN4480365.1 hypothetical protein [Demequina sp. EGI L300058]
MLTQQENERAPATRRSALTTALTSPLPRPHKIAMYVALFPLVAGMAWVALHAAYASEWPVEIIYTVVVLSLLSLSLAFAGKRWARVGVAVSQTIITVNLMTMFLVFMAAADPPAWVPLGTYGGLIGIAVAAVAGKVTTYRRASQDE